MNGRTDPDQDKSDDSRPPLAAYLAEAPVIEPTGSRQFGPFDCA
jgi:hypothetical protein